MSVILAAASFVVIIVALGVLSSMRIGVTPWLQYPTWLAVAMAAFFTMVAGKHPEWFEVALVASMAGMMWRHRHRLAWEVAHPPRLPLNSPAQSQSAVQWLHCQIRRLIG